MAKVRAETKRILKLQLSSTYGRKAPSPDEPLPPEYRLARGRFAFVLSNTGGDWNALSEEEKKRWADKACMNHDFGKKLEINATYGKFKEPWDKIVSAFFGGRVEEPPMFPPVPEAKQVIEYDRVSAYPHPPKKLPTILA